MAKAMSEWDKKIEAYRARRFLEHIPKTDLGMWKLLEKKGFFTTTDGSKAGDYRPWSPTADQWKWFEWVLEQQGHFMFMGARKTGKTELLLIFQCVYLIAKNPEYKVIIITGASERGKFLVVNIYDMLHALGVPLEGEAKTFVKTVANKSKIPNVRYFGVGSKTKGEHVDLIILDDPLDEKEGYSVIKRKAVSSQVRECLSMTSRLLMIGQPVHEEDIFAEYEGRIPKLTAWKSEYPELVQMTEEEFCKGNKASRRSYYMNYEGIILPDNETIFTEIQFSSVYPQELSSSRTFAFIDPSLNGSDRTALAIGSKYFDEEEQKELLIVWLYSWNKHYEACVMQMAQYIKSLAVDYVYYEDNGGNHLLLKKELSSYGIIATPFVTQENKILKIQSILGHVSRGLVRLHTKTSKENVDLVRNWSPLSTHDDVPDALSMLVRHCFKIGNKPTLKK